MDWKVMHLKKMLQAIRACAYQTFSSIMKLKTHAKITENIKKWSNYQTKNYVFHPSHQYFFVRRQFNDAFIV